MKKRKTGRRIFAACVAAALFLGSISGGVLPVYGSETGSEEMEAGITVLEEPAEKTPAETLPAEEELQEDPSAEAETPEEVPAEEKATEEVPAEEEIPAEGPEKENLPAEEPAETEEPEEAPSEPEVSPEAEAAPEPEVLPEAEAAQEAEAVPGAEAVPEAEVLPETEEVLPEGEPIPSCRFLMDGEGIDLTEETHIIGEYDGMYLLQYGTPEEAGAAFGYYEPLVGFIAADTPVHAADETAEGSPEAMTEEDNPLAYLEEMTGGDVRAGGRTIALIDTGADAEGVQKLSFLGDDGADRNGHGTRMAQRILAEAPDAKILSLKALGDDGTGDSSAVYAAILYAKEIGAAYINLSLSAVSVPENTMIERAVREAAEAGITVVGAAGNDGKNAKYYVPGKIEEAVIAGACDGSGVRLSSSNYGSSVDYYIHASSTSEAAARCTGLLYMGNTPESANVREGTDSEAPSGTDLFEIAETGLLADGIYYTTVPYSKRVERQLSDVLEDATGLEFDINLYHPSISNAANDSNGDSGIAGDMVRIWHDEDGEPYYCYDLSASDEGSRTTKHLSDVAASKVDKEKLAEVYTVAAQMTENNFRLLIDNIDTIIPDIVISAYYKNGTRYEETVTISAAGIRSYIRSGSEDALLLCRGIVQTYIWQRMNTPSWQNVLKDAMVGGGWTVNKEGQMIYVEPTHKDWSIPAKDVIKYTAMTGIGLSANGGNVSVPDEISMGEQPGDADHPGTNGGQLLILTKLMSGTLSVTKTSADGAVTSGNSGYSLQGAEFTVYTDAACSQAASDMGGNSAVLVTGADGKTAAAELTAGTYWVKETKAPKGFLQDSTPHEVTINAGGEETLTVSDRAAMDPIGILLKKIDKETGKDVRRVER